MNIIKLKRSLKGIGLKGDGIVVWYTYIWMSALTYIFMNETMNPKINRDEIPDTYVTLFSGIVDNNINQMDNKHSSSLATDWLSSCLKMPAYGLASIYVRFLSAFISDSVTQRPLNCCWNTKIFHFKTAIGLTREYHGFQFNLFQCLIKLLKLPFEDSTLEKQIKKAQGIQHIAESSSKNPWLIQICFSTEYRMQLTLLALTYTVEYAVVYAIRSQA